MKCFAKEHCTKGFRSSVVYQLLYGYFLEHLPYLIALRRTDHFFYFTIQFCSPVQVWKTTAACCLTVCLTITRKMQIYKQFIATQWQVFFRIVSNWLTGTVASWYEEIYWSQTLQRENRLLRPRLGKMWHVAKRFFLFFNPQTLTFYAI